MPSLRGSRPSRRRPPGDRRRCGGQLRHRRCRARRVRARSGSPSWISARSSRSVCCDRGEPARVPPSARPVRRLPRRRPGRAAARARRARGRRLRSRSPCVASAAATLGLDDVIADELDRAGARALARGAFGAGAAALERAASLTEAPRARGARLLRAANAMDAAGNLVRSQALAARGGGSDRRSAPPRRARHPARPPADGGRGGGGGTLDAAGGGRASRRARSGARCRTAQLRGEPAGLPTRGRCRRRADRARVEARRSHAAADAGRAQRLRARQDDGRRRHRPGPARRARAGGPEGRGDRAPDGRRGRVAARLGGGVRRRPHPAHLGRGRAAVGRLAAAPAAIADRARRARLPGRPLGACPRGSLRGDRVVRRDGPAHRARVRAGDDRPHGGRARPGRGVPPPCAGGLRRRRRVRPPARERAGRRGARPAGARPGRSRRRDRGARAGGANRRRGKAR